MHISNSTLEQMLQFTRVLAPYIPYLAGAFALITVIAMVCWTLRSTKSEDRPAVLRGFADLVRAFFAGIKSVIDSVKSLIAGAAGEEPPGLTA